MSDETTPTPEPAAKMIEHAKFERVVQAKQGLEARNAELQAEVQALAEKVAGVETLAQQLAKANEEKAELATRFSRFQAIASATGTTDEEVIEAVAWQHGRLPAEGRPELKDWIESLKADPTTAPVLLRPLFASPAEPAAAPKAAKVAGPKAVSGAGAQQAAAAPAGATQAEIRAETARALQTRDYTRLQALMRPKKD